MKPDQDRQLARAVQLITSTALGPYQSAVVRIGFGATWLLFLLRELPHRHDLYGPDGPWSWDMGRELIAGNNAFSVLLWSDSALWFEFVYGVGVLSSLLMMLGWRTRAVSVLFMVGVLSLQNRSIFVGDGGDNVVHLMAVYLVLTRCAQVWSLDARRAARDRGPGPDRAGPVLWTVLGAMLFAGTVVGRVGGETWIFVLFWGLWVAHGLWWAVNRLAPDSEPRTLLDVLANLVHNAALVVIMAEVCLIYATAGWYKIQGSRWQDGTALYYPLKLDYFTPWPELSGLLTSGGVMVMLLTYGTVLVQVAFPFTLFNRRAKNVLLVLMMLEHAAIAVLLGLPFFSLAMIAADAVFLPTGFLVGLGALVVRGLSRLPGGRGARPQGRRGSDEQPRTLVG
ncbi:HTTM domain-containing protein [Streptomyces xantholiticus]|uniref:HTTM domain-containing protein n=1 Tax=Streptomyces xantholiticus TaxID=68285 RepID=UPI001678513B|nr:HTTM domain-containing protein [Streptomyces xantholiticus]GGW59777.1 HTTM domain-containing protein [Streptomyces xantholiticus]